MIYVSDDNNLAIEDLKKILKTFIVLDLTSFYCINILVLAGYIDKNLLKKISGSACLQRIFKILGKQILKVVNWYPISREMG